MEIEEPVAKIVLFLSVFSGGNVLLGEGLKLVTKFNNLSLEMQDFLYTIIFLYIIISVILMATGAIIAIIYDRRKLESQPKDKTG